MLRSPSVARRPWLPSAAIALVFLAVSLVVIADPLTAHDEGQLMFGFSRSLTAAFLPNLFWQKIKPALALTYLPIVPFGFGAYLAAHVLVAAAGVAAIGEVARALGHRRPWLPALVVALSPLYAWSAVVGVSNSDGIAAVALFLYFLVVADRPLVAGLVLGVMPWVRYECAAFAAVVGLYLLATRRSARLLAGLAAWPAAYLGAGAVYHRDPLWFFHFLPNVSRLMPGNETWAGEFDHHDLASLLGTLSLITPTIYLLVFLRPERLSSVERALGAFALLFLGLFAFTHLAPRNLGPAFVLGFSPRYALLALPVVALLVGRAVEALDGARPHLRDSAVALGLLVGGWLVSERVAHTVPLLAGGSAAFMIVSLRIGAAPLGVAASVALAAYGPLASERDLAAFPVRDEWVAEATQWLEAHRTELGNDVYTNNVLLPLYLDRSGRLPGVRVRFLVAADHQYEMRGLTNASNGQTEAVLATIPKAIVPDVVMPEELRPDRVAPGTVFVLQEDLRTKLILPPSAWEHRMRPLGTIGRGVVSRFEG